MPWLVFRFSTYKNPNMGKTIAGVLVAGMLVEELFLFNILLVVFTFKITRLSDLVT